MFRIETSVVPESPPNCRMGFSAINVGDATRVPSRERAVQTMEMIRKPIIRL